MVSPSPDAYWYVVNHEMGVDPDARKLVFEGSEGNYVRSPRQVGLPSIRATCSVCGEP